MSWFHIAKRMHAAAYRRSVCVRHHVDLAHSASQGSGAAQSIFYAPRGKGERSNAIHQTCHPFPLSFKSQTVQSLLLRWVIRSVMTGKTAVSPSNRPRLIMPLATISSPQTRLHKRRISHRRRHRFHFHFPRAQEKWQPSEAHKKSPAGGAFFHPPYPLDL